MRTNANGLPGLLAAIKKKEAADAIVLVSRLLRAITALAAFLRNHASSWPNSDVSNTRIVTILYVLPRLIHHPCGIRPLTMRICEIEKSKCPSLNRSLKYPSALRSGPA